MQVFAMDTAGLHEQETLFFAGAVCTVRSNSAALLRTLAEATAHAALPAGSNLPLLTLDLRVNGERAPLDDVPHFRGQQHVVVARFGSANIFVFDLLRRHVSGTVTAELERDADFWKETLLPIAIGIMGAAVGVLPVHCACFSLGGEGILIAGVSGAGKSTLSAELCRLSADLALEYLSDDWTYITQQQGRLIAHGVEARIKLLPDATTHFPALHTVTPRATMNGEVAYEVHPAQVFGAQMLHQCTPRWLFFLERSPEPGIHFKPLTREYARNYLNQQVELLPAELPEAILRRARLMNAVAELPAWHLRYGGTPAFAARQLRDFLTTLRQECA